MDYVRYNLWPVGYRKLSTSCFTMTGCVLHRLAMPYITDNVMSIHKQTHNIQEARDDLGYLLRGGKSEFSSRAPYLGVKPNGGEL